MPGFLKLLLSGKLVCMSVCVCMVRVQPQVCVHDTNCMTMWFIGNIGEKKLGEL